MSESLFDNWMYDEFPDASSSEFEFARAAWNAAIDHQKEIDAVIIGNFADGVPDNHIVTIEELQDVIRKEVK